MQEAEFILPYFLFLQAFLDKLIFILTFLSGFLYRSLIVVCMHFFNHTILKCYNLIYVHELNDGLNGLDS